MTFATYGQLSRGLALVGQLNIMLIMPVSHVVCMAEIAKSAISKAVLAFQNYQNTWSRTWDLLGAQHGQAQSQPVTKDTWWVMWKDKLLQRQ